MNSFDELISPFMMEQGMENFESHCARRPLASQSTTRGGGMCSRIHQKKRASCKTAKLKLIHTVHRRLVLVLTSRWV